MELVYAIGELPLPNDVKETAILTCGGHFQAKYELYAHEVRITGCEAVMAWEGARDQSCSFSAWRPAAS